MAKRKRKEFDAFQVKQCTKKAIVHGPVKKSERDEKGKYFDGHLADNKGYVRVVSFHPSLGQVMHDSLAKQQ